MTIDQSTSYLLSQKYLKSLFLNNFKVILIILIIWFQKRLQYAAFSLEGYRRTFRIENKEPNYSIQEDITSGVPQGFILETLLFNIFLRDLFLEDENNYFVNYSDDTTSYFVSDSKVNVMRILYGLGEKLLTGFANNQMKSNHLLLSIQENPAFHQKALQ